jgi:hypothetical protein
MRVRTLGLFASSSLLALALVATPAADAAVPRGPIVVLKASQSSNWSGYNQGILEAGKSPFTQVSADWIVPTVTQHQAGRAEYSASWVGIGGGCLDTTCTLGDNTLIQAGTSHDINVKADGKATYSAWWELIPGPSLTIDGMPVAPGDTMHVDIREIVPLANVWTITVKNVTQNKTFTMTVPYTSTHATAEWIVETPLLIGASGAGFSSMPNLTGAGFSNATANNAAAGLVPDEQVFLVDASTGTQRLATPSAPTANGTAFRVCTYSTSC